MNRLYFRKLYFRSVAIICVTATITLISNCAMAPDSLSVGSLYENTYDYSNPVICPWFNTEEYASLNENPFLSVSSSPLSTFNEGTLPPSGAVRLEEFINYFNYEYPEPQGSDPIGAFIEIAACPWNSGHSLAKIGIKARTIPEQNLPRPI